MLLVFQFPVADTRPFGSGVHDRLTVPQWPHPNTKIPPEFVHYFGKTVARRRGADHAWTDELSFCLARRGVRFDDLAIRRMGPEATGFRPAVAFRRLFCDGNTVVRLEVGLTHNARRKRLQPLDAAAVLQIATDASGVPTWVPPLNGADRDWKPLIRQGKNIARLYARASKARSHDGPAAAPDHAVLAGSPMLLIELDGLSPIDFPSSFAAVDPTHTRGAVLQFGLLHTPAGVVSTWVLQAGTATRADRRSLRLCLLRLHAEHECLDTVLHQIQTRRIPEAAPPDDDNTFVDQLNAYLNVATRLLNKKEWSSGISQSAILDAYDAAETVTPVANRSLLTDRFEGARRQVWEKAKDYQVRRAATRVVQVTRIEKGATYVDKNITVSGQGNIVNVAEYMNNVTNTVTNNLQQSNASAEVQALVKTLTEQIKALSTTVDPQTTTQMADDVEVLSKEMARPEPRRKWYDVSLAGLKEAAEAVGELGVPIVATLKKLAPLLLAA